LMFGLVLGANEHSCMNVYVVLLFFKKFNVW